MSSPTNRRVSVASSRLPEIRGFFRTTVSSANRHVISQFLLDAEMEMRGYDVEMSRLKTEMHILESKKKGLKNTMERCRSLLVPVHRLPQEILTLVFSFACQPNKLKPSSIPPAINISWVCGRWREVVLGGSSLWADLQIDFSDWKGKFSILERVVRVFMERSKSHELKLSLNFDDMGEDTNHTTTTFDILFQNRSRWRNASLIQIPADFAIHHEENSTLHFPSLQLLELVSDHEVPALDGLFKNSPALHTLELSSDGLLYPRLNIPWRQIRALTIGPSYAPVGLEFLPLFSSLSTLELNRVGDDIRDYKDHVFLSTPTSLTMSSSTQSYLDTTLPYLTLPNITTLRMAYDTPTETDHEGEWDILDTTPITDFLVRSACSITSFSLVDIPASDDQVITLLRLMPTVTNLELEEAETSEFISGKLIRHLTIKHEGFSSGPIFLPLLTHLNLSMWKDSQTEHDLFDVVASRWRPDLMKAKELGIECLRSVNITFFDEEDGDLENSLQCFRDVGLRVKVSRKVGVRSK